MKTLKIIAAIAAFLIFVPFKSANAQVNLNLGNAAVSAATAKAKSNLLGQMAKATKDTADNGDTQMAGSILTDLFKSLK